MRHDFRGLVGYGFVATRFRGRQGRVRGHALDPELLHAATQSVGMKIEDLAAPRSPSITQSVFCRTLQM